MGAYKLPASLVCRFFLGLFVFSPSFGQVPNEPAVSFTKTAIGFYYPTGSREPFPATGGTWLGRDAAHGGSGNGFAYFPDLYHIGVDILTTEGTPVYAIATGVVYDVSTGGWNNDQTNNNVGLLIKHTRADGTEFLAIYGHIHTTLQAGDMVTGGVEFATVGHWLCSDGVRACDHLHFAIHPAVSLPMYKGGPGVPTADSIGFGTMGNNNWPAGVSAGQINSNPSAYSSITNGFVDPIAFIENGVNTPKCQNGSSERYLPGGQIPVHPDSTIVKIKNHAQTYVLRGNQRLLIPDRQTLNTLYGYGRGFDFQDIITISPDELSQYQDGGTVSAPLPNNYRNAPDGRIIEQWSGSEISIVSRYFNYPDGIRRPFSTGSAFLNLGYAECNVAGVSDYYSGYPTPPGPVVENMSQGFQAAGGVDPSYSISGASSPSPPQPGQPAAITVSILNQGGTANNKNVDIEIYNSAGTQVFQEVFSNEFFTSGAPSPYQVIWTPPANGIYKLKTGIFNSDWSFDYWNDSVLVMTVGSVPPPAMDIWWPTDQSQVSGTQPFKALLEGLDVSTYSMYWQVDSGQLNAMYNSSTDYPHKEAMVDVSGWNWKGSGPYVITFVSKDSNGNLLTQRSVSITVVH